jgi:hypothetical protein
MSIAARAAVRRQPNPNPVGRQDKKRQCKKRKEPVARISPMPEKAKAGHRKRHRNGAHNELFHR